MLLEENRTVEADKSIFKENKCLLRRKFCKYLSNWEFQHKDPHNQLIKLNVKKLSADNNF